MPDSNSSNWADMAASMLGKLSGGVELSCAFDQIELQVPNALNPNAPAATWKLNGSLRIRTRGEQPAASVASVVPVASVAPAAPVAPQLSANRPDTGA